MSGEGEPAMLGPALSRLFADLTQIPNEDKSEYERQLYRELKFLAEIKEISGCIITNIITAAQNIIGETGDFSNRSLADRLTRFSCSKSDCPNKAH